MEKVAHKGATLSNVDRLIFDTLNSRTSPPSSPIFSSKSQSYFRIYTSNSRIIRKDLNGFERTTQATFWNYRMKKPSIDYKDLQKQTSGQDTYLLLENRFFDTRRNLLQAKSDFLDIKRDIATYEYEFAKNASISLILMKVSNASANLPIPIEDFQNSNLSTSSHLHLLKEKFSQIHQSAQTHILKKNKEYVKENMDVRAKTSYNKLFLIYQCLADLSCICCSIQILTNSLYKTIVAVALLPSGQSLKTNIDRKIITSKETDLSKTIKNDLVPKLFLTNSNDDLFLNWHDDYGSLFFTIITQVKGYKKPVTLLLKEKSSKGLVLIYGETELEIAYSRLQIKKLEKSSLRHIKKKLIKHLYYDSKIGHLQWIENANSMFDKKEKNSLFLDLNYIYEVLGIKLFHFNSYFMYELGEDTYKIEIWVYKEHAMIKVFKNLKLIDQTESGAHNFKFVTDLQILDIISSPLTLSRSLEFKFYLKSLEFECLNSSLSM
ncbi:unnamed protein product [Blepharisma stoltei]|uniref:Uncharacterized protein n=1 Tax=Blepharisma stoltei TaxID=1481888 RepID=A0AAU9J1N4_9CILI|nr:unnamed protein product [Blepharisma stoltei]